MELKDELIETMAEQIAHRVCYRIGDAIQTTGKMLLFGSFALLLVAAYMKKRESCDCRFSDED